MLLALLDGRALAASVLAAEAGVAPSTASGHLRLLTEAGLLRVERHGRHRYYRLGGPEAARFLEAAAQVAPRRPVTSLREGTRAHALRTARTCYDHLAGRLGVEVMRSMLERGHLVGHDGTFDPATATADRLSSRGRDHDYRLTDDGRAFLAGFGVDVPAGAGARYCVDWSEQRHHLSGALGRRLLDRLLALGWVERRPGGRWLAVPPAGVEGFAEVFAIPEPRWRVAA
jgi:DNA-binding transcriptional ArsR family regulator